MVPHMERCQMKSTRPLFGKEKLAQFRLESQRFYSWSNVRYMHDAQGNTATCSPENLLADSVQPDQICCHTGVLVVMEMGMMIFIIIFTITTEEWTFWTWMSFFAEMLVCPEYVREQHWLNRWTQMPATYHTILHRKQPFVRYEGRETQLGHCNA